MTQFPDTVIASLWAYLPDYATARKSAPLWTYHRHAWSGVDWPERLRWSSIIPFIFLDRTFRTFAANAGLGILRFPPHQTNVAAVRTGSSEGEVGEFPVPHVFRAMVAAIYAATAPTIPTEPAQIVIPDQLYRQAGLDDSDVETILNRLRHWLFREEGLLRFVHHHVRAVRDEDEADGSLEPPEKLALKLCRAARLLPRRTGGAKTSLTDDMILNLHDQAVELVKEIRVWNPPPTERVELVRAVVDQDSSLRFSGQAEFDTWSWAAQRARNDTARRIAEKRAARSPKEKFLSDTAVWLRFPFLTPTEIRAAQAGTVKKAARQLLLGRLPGELSPKSLANAISRARNPQPD